MTEKTCMSYSQDYTLDFGKSARILNYFTAEKYGCRKAIPEDCNFVMCLDKIYVSFFPFSVFCIINFQFEWFRDGYNSCDIEKKLNSVVYN